MSSDTVFAGDFIAKANDNSKAGTNTYVHLNKILASVVGNVTYNVESIHPPAPVPVIDSIILGKVAGLSRRNVWVDIIAIEDKPVAGTFRGLLRKEDIRATHKDQAEPCNCFRPGDIIRARIINLLGRGLTYLGGDHYSFLNEQDTNILSLAKAISSSVKLNTMTAIRGNASCLLSTAEPNLGVVFGIGRSSESASLGIFGATSGNPLIPVAWTEMICPDTLNKFPRKVARVPPEFITELLMKE